jgi:PPOX class probable F420-dependent enzyme
MAFPDLDREPARELLGAPLVASLATLNEDGTAHVVPVWFLRDGGAVLVGTSAQSRKARNAARDPRVTLMLHDSPGGMDVRGLTLYGRAEVFGGEEAAVLNDRIHRKYVTEEGLELPAVAAFLAGDDVTLRVVPERVVVFDETQTEAARALRQRGAYVPTRGIR